MALRTPSAWATAQREFHLAYAADASAFDRCEVLLDWADGPEPHRRRGLRGWAMAVVGLAQLVQGRFGGPEVTVLTTEGSTRAMRFPVDLERPPSGEVTDVATLVGEIGTNAVCCLELDGTVIWPSYNPTELTRPG